MTTPSERHQSVTYNSPFNEQADPTSTNASQRHKGYARAVSEAVERVEEAQHGCPDCGTRPIRGLAGWDNGMCPTCGGTGEPVEQEAKEEPCPRCEGLGVLCGETHYGPYRPHERACPTCHGTGRKDEGK